MTIYTYTPSKCIANRSEKPVVSSDFDKRFSPFVETSVLYNKYSKVKSWYLFVRSYLQKYSPDPELLFNLTDTPSVISCFSFKPASPTPIKRYATSTCKIGSSFRYFDTFHQIL